MAALSALATAGDQSGTSDGGQKACYSKGKSGSRLKWLRQDPAPKKSDSKVTPVQHTEPAPQDADGQSSTSDSSKPAGEWAGTDGDGSGSAPDGRRARAPATILPDPEAISHGPQPAAAAPGTLPDEPPVEFKPHAGSPKPPVSVETAVKPADAARPGGSLKPVPFEGASGPKRLEPEDLCRSPKDLKRINELTTNIAPSEGDLPHDCSLGNDVFQRRSFAPITYAWTASGLCHKPLYFEDVQLERYGHMAGPWVQPFASCADFFLTIPILPYKMGLEAAQ